ncbi:MAG TPA: hypothetical protein VIN67_11630, partial [Desulfobaccales bacterium]
APKDPSFLNQVLDSVKEFEGLQGREAGAAIIGRYFGAWAQVIINLSNDLIKARKSAALPGR